MKGKITNILFLVVFYFYFVLAKFASVFLCKKDKKSNSVLYLTAFFPGNSGYEWRANKWRPFLEKNGQKVTLQHAIDKEDFYALMNSNTPLFLIKFLHKRFWQVLAARNYQTVIVRRELLVYNDYGNLFLDKLLLKLCPNAILDFDDDIAYAKDEPREIKGVYGKLLGENGTKFTNSLQLYKYFITGSQYLKDYTLQRNTTIPPSNILVLPTCVDYQKYEAKNYATTQKTICFGWVGGNHNLFLLDTIVPALNEIHKTHPIELLVIAGQDYVNADARFKIVDERWRLDTEIESIKKIDIGLMPLKNTARDKGKCSFKLIQYMGLGIVSVASNVGMNKEVISAGENEGFLADDNWEAVLMEAIEKQPDWATIGLNARNKIINNYGFEKNTAKLLNYLSTI